MDITILDEYLYEDIINIIGEYLGNKIVVYTTKNGSLEIRDHIPSPYISNQKIQKRDGKNHMQYLVYLDDINSKYRKRYDHKTMKYIRKFMYGDCPGMPWNPGIIHSKKKCLLLLNEELLSFQNYIKLNPNKVIKNHERMQELNDTGRYVHYYVYDVFDYSSPQEIINFVKKYKPKRYSIRIVPNKVSVVHDEYESFAIINEEKYYIVPSCW